MKIHLDFQHLVLLGLGIGALVSGGCGVQGLVNTEIKADGFWTRTLKFTKTTAAISRLMISS